jgi:hypothetical protein
MPVANRVVPVQADQCRNAHHVATVLESTTFCFPNVTAVNPLVGSAFLPSAAWPRALGAKGPQFWLFRAGWRALIAALRSSAAARGANKKHPARAVLEKKAAMLRLVSTATSTGSLSFSSRAAMRASDEHRRHEERGNRSRVVG